ncbi:MAG: glycoside hydrolase family 16 protein, partial [Candidatus Glassbacteria bacterium]
MYRVLLLIALVCGAAKAQERKLIWSDEFDYAGLPDSTRWSYEEGFVRNEELQYYTRARRENVLVENGMLVLTALKEKFKNPAYEPSAAGRGAWGRKREFAEYTSASVSTQNKKAWKYGRIEVRAKIPTGLGMWPAIWMLGTNIGRVGWPMCGEIDIMENVGFNPDTIYGTVHTKKFNHVQRTQKGSRIGIVRPYDDFHVYAVEWDGHRIDFFVDSAKYFTFENDGTGEEAWPFDREQYLILNIAVGGAWGGAKGMDDSIFPRRM